MAIGPQLIFVMATMKIVLPLFLFFFIMYIFVAFKYILVLRHLGPTGYVKFTEFGLARKIQDKETKDWKLQRLFKRKEFIPIPSEEAKSIMKGGRHIVEYYVTEDGSYAPIHAPIDVTNKVLGGFDPVSRAQYVMQERSIMAKAETWKQMIFPIAAMALLAIVIVSGMLFYGKVAAPLIKQSETNGATAAQLTLLTTEINRLTVNVQRLQEGEKAIPPPQTVS